MNLIKEEFLKGNPHVRKFYSISHFMDFCKRWKLDTSNSEVYYDKEEDRNYLMSDRIDPSMD